MTTGAASSAERAPGDGFLVLWSGSPGDVEVRAALRAEGVRIEEATARGLRPRANGRAPDAIVLVGDLGRDPQPVVDELSEHHPAASIPVIAIGPGALAQPKLKRRFGLVARLDETEGKEGLARRVLKLLRSLSRRPSRWRERTQRNKAGTLIEGYRAEGRVGLLILPNGGAAALGEEELIAPKVPTILSALSEDEVDLTFYERPPGRIRVLREPQQPVRDPVDLRGARVLIVDGRADRGGALAATLERAGAETRVARPNIEALRASRTLDPTVVVIGGQSLLEGVGGPLWQEPRLAAASLLVLSRGFLESLLPAHVVPSIAELCAPELALTRRLTDRQAIPERLATLGAARWLKILGRCDHEVTLRIFAASGRGRVDLAVGKIRGAAFHPADTRSGVVEGRAAVQMLLALPFGRVLAGPLDGIRGLERTPVTRHNSMVGVLAPSDDIVPFIEPLRAPGAPPELPVVPSVVSLAPTPEHVPAVPDETDFDSEEHLPHTKPGGQIVHDLFGVPDEVPPDQPRDADTDSYDATQLRKKLRQAVRSEPSSPALRLPDPVAELPPLAAVRPTSRQPAGALPPTRQVESSWGRNDSDLRLPPSLTTRMSSSLPPASERSAPPSERETEPPRRSTRDSDEPTGTFQTSPIDRLGESSRERDAPPTRPVDISRELIDSSKPPIAATVPRSPRSSGTGWFVAGVAVALAVGVWAAWRIGAEPEVTATPVRQGPSVEPVEPQPVEPRDAARAEEPMTARRRPIDALIEASEAAVAERDFDRAEVLARQALDQDDASPEAMYRLAVALFRQHNYGEALEWSQRATAVNPDAPTPYALTGNIMSRTGDITGAIASYEECLRRQPNFEPAQRQLDRLRERIANRRPREAEPAPEGPPDAIELDTPEDPPGEISPEDEPVDEEAAPNWAAP